MATINPLAGFFGEISGVQHSRRRTTYVSLINFTPSSGEQAADMTYMRTSLGDGVTVAGLFSAKAALDFRSTAGVTPYNVKITDSCVLVDSGFAYTIVLPSVLNYPPGQKLIVGDARLSSVANITLLTANSGEHMIFNQAGSINKTTSVTFATGGFGITLAIDSSTNPTNWVGWF